MDPGGWERDIVLCGRVSPAFNVDVVSWWFLDFWCTCCLLELLLELLFFGREEESDLNGPLFEILFQAYIVLFCTLVWGVDIYSKSCLNFWSRCLKIHSRQNSKEKLLRWLTKRQWRQKWFGFSGAMFGLLLLLITLWALTKLIFELNNLKGPNILWDCQKGNINESCHGIWGSLTLMLYVDYPVIC